MNEYTKGEWIVEKLADDCCLIMANESTCVARTYKTYFPSEAVEANAKLIASAPNQNKALREIDQWLINNMVNYKDDGTLHIIHCHIQDALAKAE